MTIFLLIATVLAFIIVDRFRLRSKAAAHDAASRPVPVPAFRMPEGIYFSKGHAWLSLFPDGSVRVGVDDFVSRMFTHPTLTLLKKEGEMVKKGEAIIRLEEEGRALALRSPIEGRIRRRNARGTSVAMLRSKDVFLRGWAYQMEPKGGASAVRGFLLGAETRAWMKEEVMRFRDFVAQHAAPSGAALVLQDGGEPVGGVLGQLPAEACAEFERQFLSDMEH